MPAGCKAGRPPADRGKFGIGGGSNLVTFSAGALWTITEDAGRLALWRIDPLARTNRSVLGLRGSGDARFAVAGGTVWISDSEAGTLTAIELKTGRKKVLRPFGPEGEPTAIAIDDRFVWLIANNRGEVAVVDRAAENVIRRVTVGGDGLADIERGLASIWVSTAASREVVRIQASSLRVTGRAEVGGEALKLAVGAGGVWVDLGDRDAVQRVDAGTLRTRQPLPNGGSAFSIEAAYGSVWITNFEPDTVTRLDARTGRRVATTRVGRDPKGLVAGAGSIWVVNAGECSISRLRP